MSRDFQFCVKCVSSVCQCVFKGWIEGRPVSSEFCEVCQVCFKCVSNLGKVSSVSSVCQVCVKCFKDVSSVCHV